MLFNCFQPPPPPQDSGQDPARRSGPGAGPPHKGKERRHRREAVLESEDSSIPMAKEPSGPSRTVGGPPGPGPARQTGPSGPSKSRPPPPGPPLNPQPRSGNPSQYRLSDTKSDYASHQEEFLEHYGNMSL